MDCGFLNETMKIRNRENLKDFRGFENVNHFQTFQVSFSETENEMS